jgi:hypothetical protein
MVTRVAERASFSKCQVRAQLTGGEIASEERKFRGIYWELVLIYVNMYININLFQATTKMLTRPPAVDQRQPGP